MKFLTFMLANQFCGIDLACVRELIGYLPFAPIAGEHPAFVGWLDLRGRPVRVVDLRARFGLRITRTDDTVMIIVESLGQTMAMIVDRVVGLERLASNSSIDSLKRSTIDPRFVKGVASIEDRIILLLDVPRTIVLPPPMPKAA